MKETERTTVILGSTGVSPVGFGVPPKQAFDSFITRVQRCSSKSSRKRDAFTNTRDARAPQAMR